MNSCLVVSNAAIHVFFLLVGSVLSDDEQNGDNMVEMSSVTYWASCIYTNP